MPLDPDVQMLLADMQAAGGPDFETLPPAEGRRLMLAGTAALGPPTPVREVRDEVLAGPGGPLPVRVYRDREGGKLPGAVFFHGGGWVLGSIDTHDGFCRALCQASGAVIVSVDYRLAPEHPYPAAAEDAYAATAWAAAHADELGVDPRRLGVIGDSAGGNLAAVAALLARERGGPAIAGQVLIYPITDGGLDTPSYTENAEGYYLTRAQMEWFWELYAPRPEQRAEGYASPLRAASLAGLPPALVLTCGYDPLRDEGEAYAARLAAADVPVRTVRFDGAIHGIARRFARVESGRALLRESASFLAQW